LAVNFTIINAQQLAGQPGEIENGTTAATTFQSTNDGFRVQVPEGWGIQDMNNTGTTSEEEVRLGYGILAQLCTEEHRGVLSNASGSTNSSSISNSNSCQEAQEELIHIVRYPDLDTRLLTNNVTANNMTIDNILSYHVQKLQEVGYRGIQIANSTEMTVNLTIGLTNQTIATVPAKLVEMTYSTNFAPNEIRRGYFVLTATNATAPNLGTTKGYTVFYEGSSVAAAAETTMASNSLLPPIPVMQVFDSFELIAAPEVAQAIAQGVQAAESTEGGGDGDEGDNGDGGDGNGNGNGNEGDRNEGDNRNRGDGDGDNGDGGDGNGNGNEGDRNEGDGGALMELVERLIEEAQDN
jgi:hypothetical protein